MSVKSQQETRKFETETQQLLHLVAHALYSNKEVFMRELISNASDAAEKLRFEAISNDKIYEGDGDLKIKVDFDKDKKTISISDNGIGMSRQDVIDNLGTIASSGTKKFIENLTGDSSKDSQLIGQFGVGFYSAFVVADKVSVTTRKAGEKPEDGVYWESTGEGEYVIQNIEKADRGTTIVLRLKEEEEEFLDHWRLRSIITKYSDHIVLPIEMKRLAEGKEDENEKTASNEIVNQATALWARPKREVTEEQYKEFYKHVSHHDMEDPLAWSHNRVEGKLQYISLLYIPGKAPFDLWMRERNHGLKLYVQRVFIMDETEKLLPLYLRFVRGVLDSSDLPLNVSRELLQSNKVIESMKAASTKRVLDMLEKMAENEPEKYQTFWDEMGNVLKEGPAEDFANKDRIAKLLRFATTNNDTPIQNQSFADYVSRMKDGQDKIYYVTGESYEMVKNSPHLEFFKKKGVEVLLLSDRIDEWLVNHLTEFEGKQLQSITHDSVDFEKFEDKKDKKEQKKVKSEFKSVTEKMKEVLSDKVEDVRTSERLTDSPACLVASSNDMSLHMKQMMEAMGQKLPETKPIMEINPSHPIIKRLKDKDIDDAKFNDWANVMFDQAFLAEGGQLKDPAQFVKRLNDLLVSAAS